MHVRIVFNYGAEVEALGRTELGEERGLHGAQVVATVSVRPGETLPFVKGKLDGFRAKYEAYRTVDGELVREPM
ncbi:hypothetical protein AGDE_16719 [Angomonas deanei]|uniref:DUF1935 domain-containing protein n=1 Tax=Angomonas deanei TaxID=59799 RepID=A0A7G2C5X9_9TRYP|nr:hypothetical protein AGDE_16719 [Angomonas deanei]CAD2215170.1 Domain of unknown function (DUF1935), putative [Angomonas deanei]|eukprot:EPY16544.1 hypothetical protein AGDE_16719 [Angomonas deanei]